MVENTEGRNPGMIASSMRAWFINILCILQFLPDQTEHLRRNIKSLKEQVVCTRVGYNSSMMYTSG